MPTCICFACKLSLNAWGCVCNFCSLGFGRGLLCGRGSCSPARWGSVRAVFGRVRLCLGACSVVSVPAVRTCVVDRALWLRNLASRLCMYAPSLCLKTKIYIHINMISALRWQIYFRYLNVKVACCSVVVCTLSVFDHVLYCFGCAVGSGFHSAI